MRRTGPRKPRLRSTGLLLVVSLTASGCSTMPASTAPASALPASTAPAATAPVATAAASPASTPASLETRLDHALTAVEELAQGGVAASVITADGEWHGVAGNADAEENRAVTPDTVFAIGSVTKTFVAALVLRLAERGLVDLDQPLADYLPADVELDLNDATVRQALGHTSGIGEHTSSPGFGEEVVANPARTWTPDEALAFAGPSLFPAGSRMAYSNTNYLLLGLVVQEVTGRSLGDALDAELLEPAGLDRIVYQPERAPPEPVAVGRADLDRDGSEERVEGGGMLPTKAFATVAGAAGGMASDAPSLARWGRLLYGGEVLAAESLDALIGPSGPGANEYGLGTMSPRFGDLAGVGHNGAIPGFSAALAHFPDPDVTVAVLTNVGPPGRNIDPFQMVALLAMAATDG